MTKDKIILYFGSFNPIHNGHLSVAKYVLSNRLCSEVWFILSPHNPLKERDTLLDENSRLAMAQLAVGEWSCAIKVLNIEFTMKRPSYTVHTIQKLRDLHPDKEFSLLIGEDNIMTFDYWRRWQDIVEMCEVLVYPRGDISTNVVNDKIRELRLEGDIAQERIRYLLAAPRIDVSSTQIRENINDIDNLTAHSVVDYIKTKQLYGRK